MSDEEQGQEQGQEQGSEQAPVEPEIPAPEPRPAGIAVHVLGVKGQSALVEYRDGDEDRRVYVPAARVMVGESGAEVPAEVLAWGVPWRIEHGGGMAWVVYTGPRPGPFPVHGGVTRRLYLVPGPGKLVELKQPRQQGVLPADLAWFLSVGGGGMYRQLEEPAALAAGNNESPGR